MQCLFSQGFLGKSQTTRANYQELFLCPCFESRRFKKIYIKKNFLVQVLTALLDKYISSSFVICKFLYKGQKSRKTVKSHCIISLNLNKNLILKNELQGSDKTKLITQRVYNACGLLMNKHLSTQILQRSQHHRQRPHQNIIFSVLPIKKIWFQSHISSFLMFN